MSSRGSDSDVSYHVRKRRKLKVSRSEKAYTLAKIRNDKGKAAGNSRKKKSSITELDRHISTLSLDPLLYPPGGNIPSEDDAFDETMDSLLPEFFKARLSLQEKELECDDEGSYLRPLTRSEISSLLAPNTEWENDSRTSLIRRKLKLLQEKRRNHIPPRTIVAPTESLHQLPPTLDGAEPKPQVLSALEDIKTTPFESSLLSRLQGTRGSTLPGLIAVDWETITPWMSLMRDIRDHYSLAHPERQQPMGSLAPITYSTLQACHLDQIHDLLERVFWTGIDVSDSLEYSPERCTVVACYKCLVIGVAILSSPQETYITYLAVKTGWDKAQIARTMLFHLIRMNPKKDITLHVSANNSAMLLYNQFGFKAEEFVAGFYEDYLDSASWASKNAFRLRLRQ